MSIGELARLKSLVRRRKSIKRLQGRPAGLAAKRLGEGQHLIVATNGRADKVLTAYRKRRQIECLFGDRKTRGLNMEDTRLTLPAKLNTRLVIITLAMAWACASAAAIKGTRGVKTRAHGYRYKSWFRLGFDQLRKWILHDSDRAANIWREIWPKQTNAFLNRRVVSWGGTPWTCRK